MGQIQTGPTRVQFGVAANTHNRSPVQSRRTSSVIESRPPTTTAIRNPRASRAFKLLDDEHRSSLLAALRVAHKNAINHPGDLRLASLFGVQLENCYKTGVWATSVSEKDWIREFDRICQFVVASDEAIIRLNTLKARIFIASGEVEEALDLLRAKFHKENDLLAAHGLIEALGLLNTKSAAAEIMQVVKIVRPTLSTKEEVSSILSVMMQHLLYKWPKGALSNQDQKFYQSIKQAKEHPNEVPPPHPREVSITVYNPTEAPVTLLFYSPHRSPGSETETIPEEDYMSFMLSVGDVVSVVSAEKEPGAAAKIIAERGKSLHTEIASDGTRFTSIEFKKAKPKEETPEKEESCEYCDVPSWGTEMVDDWIAGLHLLGSYPSPGINGARLLQLEVNDLKELGIKGQDLERVATALEALKLQPSAGGLKHTTDLCTDV